ncbi:hypothetical protein ABK040_012975 [Willaertia magna]
MSAPSAYYILDSKGKNIIHRDYRGNLPKNIIDKFIKRVIKVEEEENIQPVFEEDGYSFCFIRHKDIYLVLISNCNCNAMEMICFLFSTLSVFEHYFKEVEEESIKDNFVVVYELLDEMMDFGYPQSTEPNLLKEFIKNESNILQKNLNPFLDINFWNELFKDNNNVSGININQLAQGLQEGIQHSFSNLMSSIKQDTKIEDNSNKVTIPRNFTQTISWRKEGIIYKKNECFLDVVESVNLLISNAGTTLRSEIVGTLKMRCYLSGMPELKLGLNDKVFNNENLNTMVGKGKKGSSSSGVDLEDVKFHQCVRLNRFENERIISFVPPDGDFDLMSYRLSTRIKPLIHVEVISILHGTSRIELNVKAKSNFKKKSIANNVKIFIPVPKDADSPKINSLFGNGEYSPEDDCIIWSIKNFPGGKEYSFHAEVGLPTITSFEDENTSLEQAAKKSHLSAKKRPVRVSFEIPYFTVSGLQVRYLKIMDKSGYQALPWVRYITTSGIYEIRQ